MNIQLHLGKTLLKVIKATYLRVRYDLLKYSWLTFIIAALTSIFFILPNSYQWGSFQPYLIIQQHEWWRVLTAPFVHENWDHFTWNMIVLVASGLVCEQLNRRLFLLYIIACIISTSSFKLISHDMYAVSLGYSNIASGSFALLLILISYEGIKERDIWLSTIPAVMFMMFVSHELNLLWGESTGWKFLSGSNIDNATTKKIKPGHIIGIITGSIVALSYVFTTLIKKKSEDC